jgi:chromosome segregation ATPase
MLSGFGARRAPASEQSAASPSADADETVAQNRSELTLAEIGARLGEDNEKLRNLLIDTGHRIGAIGDVQQAFRSLAEPVNTAIRELDQERIENGKLRSSLAELRIGYDNLHGKFAALEKRAAELDTDRAGSEQQLAHAQQNARGLQRDKSELTTEVAAARANLEQMEISLLAAQAERSALCTARDEADERHRSDAYTLNVRIEALRARATTAEKLLSEARQSLVLRTEELRLSERKTAEAIIARTTAEKTIEALTTARDALGTKAQKLELGRKSLTERSNSLAETLKAREASLTQAEQKIKLLTDRVAEIDVDAGAYRAKTERRIEELTESLQRERAASREAVVGKIREFEQTRAMLIERSNSLAEKLRVREAEIAQGEQKIKSLTDRIAEMEAGSKKYRDAIERRIEELNETLQHERSTARDALDAKIMELEKGRTSLIERSNSLAEALMTREASRGDAEARITSLTDRITEIEAEAETYRKETERRLAELTDSLDRERTAGRAALDEKMREFERERALLLERSDTQAGILKAREAEVAQAAQNVTALTDRLAEIEAEAAAYRAKAEGRIGELQNGLQRERMDHDSVHASLHAKTMELEQQRASATAQSAGLAQRLKAREIALAENAQEIKSLADRIGKVELATQAYRTEAERHISEFNERFQRERTEQAANREMTARNSLAPQREIPGGRVQQDRVTADSPPQPTAPEPSPSPNESQGGQIAVFVSRKEGRILVHEGLVPLFTIPIVIEDPDRPLGTHVFTAVGSTEDGTGIGWKLVTDAGKPSGPVKNKDAVQAPSRATEALNRIRWPNEAGDRLIDLLIPGASLVISDDELGPITRSWCERIKHAGRMRR